MAICVCPYCMHVTSESKCEHCGQTARSVSLDATLIQPETILHGQYLIGYQLGQGGFGITYLAQRIATGERVCIKEFFMKDRCVRDAGDGLRVCVKDEKDAGMLEKGKSDMLREATLLHAMDPLRHVVHVQDVFSENNTAYIVMDYIMGETLEDYLISHGSLSFAKAYRLLRPMMVDLTAMHGAHILHRDINPRNILITPNGNPVLIDFGSSRIVSGAAQYYGNAHLTVLVTHHFAPMEQYRTDGTQGPWSDVYGLCATLYFAITGKQPPISEARYTQDLLVAPSQTGADIPAAAETALLSGLSVLPANRVQSVDSLVVTFDKAASVIRQPANNIAKRLESQYKVATLLKRLWPAKAKQLLSLLEQAQTAGDEQRCLVYLTEAEKMNRNTMLILSGCLALILIILLT